MKTYNVSYSSPEQLASFLNKHQIQDNSQLLIQVFTAQTDIEWIQQLQSVFQQLFSEATLIGASSDGNIIDAEVPELGQTTVSFTQFVTTSLVVAFVDKHDSSFDAGVSIGLDLKADNLKAVISFTDGTNMNGEAYLNGLSSICPSTVISGGMAGDNGQLKQTVVFTLDRISSDGAVAIGLINPKLIAETRYNFDWRAVGQPMMVTRAKENVVYEIDHQPAVKVYEKYLGREVAANLPMTGIEFPLVKLDKGTLIGRAVLSKLDKGALRFAGNLNQGDVVQFAIASKDEFIRDTYLTIKTLDHMPVESIFVYSCMARRRFLGKSAGCELEPYKNIMTVTGFYTYGEFYYSQESCSSYLLNETLTLLALSESDESTFTLDKLSSSRGCRSSGSGISNTLTAVSNLAVAVSNDLATLNGMLEHEVDAKTKELISKSLIDELTQLPNRQTLLNDLRHSDNSILIVINVNDFSRINGFYGLTEGDKFLLQISIKLQQVLKDLAHLFPNAKLYKLPADKFAIITSFNKLKMLPENLKALDHKVFGNSFKILGFDIVVGATWVFSQTDSSDKSLLQAELMVKEARRQQSNFVFTDINQFKESKEKIEMAHIVRDSILAGRVYPVYQPIYSNQTGKIAKYECLARMTDDKGQMLSPYQFIEISKMVQMYPELTHSMIDKSFQAFQGTDLKFSINLGLDDIQNDNTQQFLFSAIEKYQVADQLTIEILENQALTEGSRLFEFIDSIKKLGVSIAIDDFGSGHANYTHLGKLKADIVKIDGSLIQKLGIDPVATSVVDSMLLFAEQLNIEVVAEFVSDADIYEMVKLKKIDYSQGYYLSEPLVELPKK